MKYQYLHLQKTSKKFPFFAAALLVATLSAKSQTAVNLSPLFNADVFLEPGGVGLGGALDPEGRWIDANSLPANFVDGASVTTVDQRATFQFAPLKQSSLDAVSLNGQTLDVTAGNYSSVDLALLAAPDALVNPFGQIEFRYSDGSKDTNRFGPVAGWFNAPGTFENVFHRYADESNVQPIVSFRTDFGAEEEGFIVQQAGNGMSGNDRFVDGNGYVLYVIRDLAELEDGKLGITVGNNFVISVSAEYIDPDVARAEGYRELANSMTLHNGFEHRALGNLKEYEFDVSEELAQGTGELYILFTDATTNDGWGPYIQQIRLFRGSARIFEERLAPAIAPSQATIHASFQTASSEEAPYLYDNSGSGPSNRGHRFADGNGSITYRFDLPDTVTNAALTVDMANNFVVSIAGAASGTRYAKATPGAADEKDFLIDEGGSNLGGDFRFADGGSYMIYQFDLPDNVTTAFARIHVGNQFVIESASGTEGEFEVDKDWYAETGEEVRDNSNLDFYTVDLSRHLLNNPSKVVRIRLSDGIPFDGWGPFLRSIEIVDKEDSGTINYQPALNAFDIFEEDIHTEYNKGYYTIDLSSVLASNNPGKEVYVKFTDGSTSDGWGPGIFWMAVHTGNIELQSDGLVFDGLKTTFGDPESYGINLLHRRYPINPAKTLTSIVLPSRLQENDPTVYLLAATLNQSSGGSAAELRIARGADNKLKISWPADQTGYRLEVAPRLTAPLQWTALPDAPQQANGEFSVEITASEQERYFRLVK